MRASTSWTRRMSSASSSASLTYSSRALTITSLIRSSRRAATDIPGADDHTDHGVGATLFEVDALDLGVGRGAAGTIVATESAIVVGGVGDRRWCRRAPSGASQRGRRLGC